VEDGTVRVVDTQLMIGGPADGRRVVVAPGTMQMWVESGISHADAPSRTLVGSAVRYWRMELRGDEQSFMVWVSHDLRPDDVLRLLTESYPQEKRS
jgi:hypothetical protein